LVPPPPSTSTSSSSSPYLFTPPLPTFTTTTITTPPSLHHTTITHYEFFAIFYRASGFTLCRCYRIPGVRNNMLETEKGIAGRSQSPSDRGE
ncbi:hypothetical protein A2U01_0062266, partial [Trifolium medium]|nr:hypothetical protein [Trifolium medium]